jgi:hypothetical protein
MLVATMICESHQSLFSVLSKGAEGVTHVIVSRPESALGCFFVSSILGE